MSSTPPAYPEQPQAYGPVPNHLIWAILVTAGSLIFCCLNCLSFLGVITGIVAIVFASQVNSKLSAGNRDAAIAASKNARTWCWITTGVLILAALISIVAIATVGVDGYMQYLEQAREQMEQRR